MFDTLFPDPFSNTTTSKEQTTCIVIEDGRDTDEDYPIELPPDLVSQHATRIETGSLIVRACGVDISNNILIQSSESTFLVEEDFRYRHLYEGVSIFGSMFLGDTDTAAEAPKTLAMVSISTLDSSSSYSAQDMADALMDPNKINLRTQFEACSFGKLQWEVAPGGLIDIKLPDTVTNLKTDNAVIVATQRFLKKTKNLKSVSDLADKVIMCLPPGTGAWAGRAGVDHWRVQMNDHWCLSLSGTMHEIGHTMGLSHSNANGQRYADRSGYMGSGYTSQTWPQKCFNAYHSYQLGWYSDKTLTISEKSPNRLIDLAAFVDYDHLDTRDEYVLINLADTYFMHFNVAKSFNIGTEHQINQLTVTEPTVNGTESLAGIKVGGIYTIEDFNSLGVPLKIEACQQKTTTTGAEVIVVSISTGLSLCPSSAKSPATTDDDRQSSIMMWLIRMLLAMKQRQSS